MWYHVRLYAWRFIIVLLVWICIRCAFFAINHALFPSTDVSRFLWIAILGLRFDASILVYINALVLLLGLLPILWRLPAWFDKVLWGVFFASNMLFLLFELTEIFYYPFTLKRSTSNLWGIKDEFIEQLPGFIARYWFIIPCIVAMYFLLRWLFFLPVKYQTRKTYPWWQRGVVCMILIVVCGVLARGGFQLRPLGPIDAAASVRQDEVPLVLNSSMTMLHSMQIGSLEEHAWYSPQELDSTFSLIRKPVLQSQFIFKGYNVVLLIIESLGQEYLSAYPPFQGNTPFIDSLIPYGLLCENMYACGRRSNEGIPSIIAGVPPLMKDPYVISAYQSNHLFGIGRCVSGMGYRSAFFHGARNGSFKLDVLAKACGYQQYFGLNEYPHPDRDHDGHWGIWDEPFLQFSADIMDTMPQPFGMTFFSLTNHHPFRVPPAYKSVLEEGPTEEWKTVHYTDIALRKFFHRVENSRWFQNTIFIITADHTNQAIHDMYRTSAGVYRIPLFIYTPSGKIKGRIKTCVSQVDILPTIAEMIGYDKPIHAFGHSIFSPVHPHHVYMYPDPLYQFIRNDTCILSDGDSVGQMYFLKKDTLLQKNIIDTQGSGDMLNGLRAGLQRFTHAMNSDQWSYKKE
jgi:hypothetical protein